MKDWLGNRNSLWKTLGASNHTDKQREENDYYATDPISIEKLFNVEEFDTNIWEVACGEGHLSEAMKRYGKTVFSTDIINRGYQDEVFDFFDATKESGFYPFSYDIITNPPYKYAKEFVEKSLEIIKEDSKVAMFLKLTFLEGKARKKLFETYPPKCVYVFSERVMCAKNGDFNGMIAGGGSAVAYAWFVWQKGYNGKTIIKWI